MSRSLADSRSYLRSEVVAFRKTNEDFGGLSNMAPGYPLQIGSVCIRTSEALYQACRFPHMPDIQRMIIEETSPMTAKMRLKPYRNQSRPDWDDVRVPVMRWCLRVKLIQNWDKFSKLLIATGNRPIVEDSRKDEYWGAKVDDTGAMSGMNVLGRLLMELRLQLRERPDLLMRVDPLRFGYFTLLGKAIPSIYRNASCLAASTHESSELTMHHVPAPLFVGF